MLQDNMMHMKLTEDHIQYIHIPEEEWNFTNIKIYLNNVPNICVAGQV